MARPAPADIPEIYAQQPQPGFDPFGDLMVLRDIQPDFSGMDFIDPSGIDIGAIDIPDAVTLLSEEDQAAIAEGQSAAREDIEFAEAEKKFAEAVAYLKAYNQGLAIDSERFTDDSGKFTDESLEAFFEGQRDAQDALQVARANYEAVGGKPETLLNEILGAATTVGAAPNVGSVAAGAGPFSQILYNIPSIAAGQPVVTGTYSQAGTQLPFEVGRKDGTIIAGTTGSEVLDQAVADVFGGEAIITETGDINVPSREDVTGAIGGIFGDPASGTLVKTAATTDTGTADEDTVVGVDTTKVALPGGADAVENVLGGFTDDTRVTGTLPNVIRDVITPDADVTDAKKTSGGFTDDTRVTGTLPNVIRDVIIPEGGGEDDDEEIVETLLTGGGGDPEVEEEIIETIETTTETPEPIETTTTATTTGGGGGTFTLPPSLRGVREEPGDVVDIDYLYDFAKGLDQPFITAEEQEMLKNLNVYAEGGEVANEDAVDMLTRPRRPGEYGRRYFTEGQFVPTGTALGGAALDPNAIQIPQYTYQREAISPQNTTMRAAPMDAISYTTAPSEDAEVDVDTLLEVVGLLGMEGLNLFAAGGMAQGQGYYLGGPTDGMADLVPATIDGTQPAALSDGEFVIPADVVSHLGNGNSEAGAQQLYSMMDRVRTERTGTTKQGPEINPTKMMPA